MDYHSMKRKELQALCKKHNIPASSANSVLADKLSELLNEKRKPTTRQRTCMKSLIETKDDDESGVSKRQEKKVRFSPDNELVEYELRSGKKQMAARRKCLPQKVEKPVVDDAVQIPVKLTRSRVQLVEQDRKTVKDVVKRTNVVKEPEVNHGKVTRSKVHKLGKRGADELENANETVEKPVVSRVRVTRSKAQTLIDDVKDSDVKLEVKKNSGKRAAKGVKIVEPVKESFDIPVRVTRSRGQPLKDDYEKSQKTVNNPQNEKKRTRRELKATDQTNSSNNVSPKRRSLRVKEVENVVENEDEKVEVVYGRIGTRSKAHLATKSSGRNSKNQADDEVVQNVGRKNVNRRKSVTQPEKTETVVHVEESVNRRNTRRKTVGKKQSNPITVHVSPVVESSKRSTRSGVKTEGKKVTVELQNSAKEQLETSPRKRAKLGDHSANMNKTPASKLVNDGKVSESEVTPVINKRFTRSAIKEQDAMLSSHKVGKFKHDPAVNTAPVRFARTGTKQNAARNLSEKVDKKKQLNKSSGPESDKLSTKGAGEIRVSLIEENGSGDSESNDKVEDVDQNPPDFPNLEDETAETNGEASLEAVPDAIPDVQNQVVNEKSAIFNEDSEKLDSENDEEPLVSVAVEESVGNTDLGKSKEIEDPVDPPTIEEDGKHEVTASEGEDQTVETVCVSPVVESSKRSDPESDKLFVVENRVSVLEGLFEENESDDKVKDAEQNPPDFPNLEDETNAVPDAIPDVQNQVVNENCAIFNEDEVEVAVVNSEKLEEKVELKISENDEEPLVSVGNADLGNSHEIEDPVDLPIIEEDKKHGVSASEGEGNKDDVLEQLIDDQPNKEEQLTDINEYDDVVTDNNERDTDNDEHVLGKSETDSMPSNDENLVLSGTVDANEEHEKSLTNNDTKIDINIDSLGQHSELSTGKNDLADVVDEIPILDHVDDEEGSEQDALNFKKSPLTDKPEVAEVNEHDDEHDEDVLGKSGTDSMPSDGENLVLSGAVNTNEKALTNIGADMDSSNANDTLDPVQNENVPVVTQVLITQSNREPQPEPEPEIGAEPEVEPVAEPETKLESKQEPEAAAEPEPKTEAEAMPDVGVCHDSRPHDAVSSIFGDILTDDEHKVSENEMSNEHIPVETDNDHVSNDGKEPLPTLDQDPDGAYDDLDYPLVENINTQENPTPSKQECTFDGPVSSQLMGDDESPITKESTPLTYGKAEKSIEVETFTEEAEKATTSLDWGNYDDTFQKPVSPNENNDKSNEFQKSVSANENNDESDEFQKLDDQSNEFHVADENDDQSTKAEGVSDPFIQERCSPAVDFVKSAKKLEQSAGKVVDEEESDEDVNLLKNDVIMTEELLDDWSDSAIKSLFVTPGVGHVKEGGRNKTPAHVENESSDVGSAQISGVKDSQMSFTFTSDKEHGTAANEFNRQSAANDTPICENEIPNFEQFSGKLFGDDHYYGMSSEAAAATTGEDDASRLKVIEKKEEEIQLKGSDDDLANF